MTHIFISYARNEAQDLARQLRDALNAQGSFTVWMDEALVSGESWASQIEEEIARSDRVIVLLTPDVNRPADGPKGRSFVLNEIDYARTQHKPIIPVLVDAHTKPLIQLAGIHYVDVTRLPSTGEQVRAVVETLVSPGKHSLSAPRKQPLFARMRRQFNRIIAFLIIVFTLKLIRRLKLNEPWAIIIAAVITGVFLLWATTMDNDDDSPTQPPAVVPSATFTNTAMPTIEVTDTLPSTAETTTFPTVSALPSASPSVSPSTTPAAFSLDFQVKSPCMLVQVGDSSTPVDLSNMRIRWNNSGQALGLHTLIWYENYSATLLDFTRLPVGSCLQLSTKQQSCDKPADCAALYVVSDYFSSLSDFYARTQSYSISLDGGNTYPGTLTCAGSQNDCHIP